MCASVIFFSGYIANYTGVIYCEKMKVVSVSLVTVKTLSESFRNSSSINYNDFLCFRWVSMTDLCWSRECCYTRKFQYISRPHSLVPISFSLFVITHAFIRVYATWRRRNVHFDFARTSAIRHFNGYRFLWSGSGVITKRQRYLFSCRMWHRWRDSVMTPTEDDEAARCS